MQQAAEPAARSRRQQQIALLIERRGAQLLGPRHRAGAERGGRRLGRHLRRHHRAGLGPAHSRLGRRGAAHRARDQESAHARSNSPPSACVASTATAITEDRETFDRCTDTIIRQVGDVTRMVDEFSAFARSPKPQMEDNDIREVVKAAVIDRQMASQDIVFDTKVGKEPIIVTCDRRLISQAVINLVKNAQEAIQILCRRARTREPGWTGRIETNIAPQRQPGGHRDHRQRSGPAQAEPHPPDRSPMSPPRAPRAPASASPSCRRASSSTPACSPSRTRRRRPGARTGRWCASICRRIRPNGGATGAKVRCR